MDKQPGQDLFLSLRTTLDEDLKATGFAPDRSPPGREPRVPRELRDLDNYSLKGLYDEFLAYYDYLSDQIAQDNGYSLIGKARLELMAATASRKAQADKSLTNADARKAFVETDQELLGAKRDYVYFKARLQTQRERRDKISKCMERIGRELWFRAQDTETSSFLPRAKRHESGTSAPNRFKRAPDE
jgi:hypothetical protein